MRQNIKAKETYYDGYRFRSRLEARWAVFFNNIGLEYEYEMEGFDMKECSYLPDFYIPSIDRWFEIKGQPLTVSEVQKCEQFCRRKDNENMTPLAAYFWLFRSTNLHALFTARCEFASLW